MKLWIDVTDAAGTRQGAGPIHAASTVTINRVMDGIGTWQISAPASNARNVDLLVPGSYVVIYGQVRGVTRELGGGQIMQRAVKDSAAGPIMQINGLDRMDDLKRVSTLIGRQYNDQAVATIAADLVGLAGWTVNADSGMGNTSISYDGDSALKALQTLAENTGKHLRLASSSSIDFGALGADTGLRLVQRRTLAGDVYDNNLIAFVDSISLIRNRTEIVNWILPLGKKDQTPRVTLEYSTRTTPYTIQNMTGPDGSTLYYLSDAASIATYGTRQAVKVWSKIEAISSDPADLTTAANALYDATAAELVRASIHQDVYKLVLVGVNDTIQPGDKVRIVYAGKVQVNGQDVIYLEIDDLFWVLDVSETLGSEGHKVTISASNIDQRAIDAAGQVARAIRKVDDLEVR